MPKKNKNTIMSRIDFIKKILKNSNLNPMIYENGCDTEAFINPCKDSSDDSKSKDTTYMLGKQKLDFFSTIRDIGGKLVYKKSGSTGHTFKGKIKGKNGKFTNYAVKVVAYPKKEDYGDLFNIERPENAELLMIKLLSYFVVKGQTPHIVLPICTFNTSIKPFVELLSENDLAKEYNEYKLLNDKQKKRYKKSKYFEFIDKQKKGVYYDTVSILISEWANSGDLLDFMRTKYDTEFTPLYWKVIFFQVISVLAVIQSKYPDFRHNDFKANNILVHKTHTKKNVYGRYHVCNNTYMVPSIGYNIKIWDFDFACIPNVVNNIKVNMEWTSKINVNAEKNRYYDLHYFFNVLIRNGFFPQFMTESCVPQEAKDFVRRIIPQKYMSGSNVANRGRLLKKVEYLTPEDVLRYDEYFEEFRTVKKKRTKKNLKNDKMNKKSLDKKNDTLSEILEQLRKDNKERKNHKLLSSSE